jgi:Fe-S-cluster containining protein
MMDNDTVSDASQVCVRCGLCCDGTLFGRVAAAKLDLPADLIQIGLRPAPGREGGKPEFYLPCPKFEDRCSIYDSRPHICRQFECGLLKSLKSGEIELENALRVAIEARSLRNDLGPGFEEQLLEWGIESDGRSLATRIAQAFETLGSGGSIPPATSGNTLRKMFRLSWLVVTYFRSQPAGLRKPESELLNDLR